MLTSRNTQCCLIFQVGFSCKTRSCDIFCRRMKPMSKTTKNDVIPIFNLHFSGCSVDGVPILSYNNMRRSSNTLSVLISLCRHSRWLRPIRWANHSAGLFITGTECLRWCEHACSTMHKNIFWKCIFRGGTCNWQGSECARTLSGLSGHFKYTWFSQRFESDVVEWLWCFPASTISNRLKRRRWL